MHMGSDLTCCHGPQMEHSTGGAQQVRQVRLKTHRFTIEVCKSSKQVSWQVTERAMGKRSMGCVATNGQVSAPANQIASRYGGRRQGGLGCWEGSGSWLSSLAKLPKYLVALPK